MATGGKTTRQILGGKINEKPPKIFSPFLKPPHKSFSPDLLHLYLSFRVSAVQTKKKEMDVENRKMIGAKKRKREPAAAAIENLTPEEKDAQIQSLKLEMESLFVYFRQTIGQTQTPDLFSSDSSSSSSSVNSMVALLMEETSLPLSKLVDEIFSKLREKIESVTMASVKTAVVSVGQRVSYGVPNADADVLEDDDESCLWCWEVTLSLSQYMFISSSIASLMVSINA